jgi:CheY-like chemotaxis protein
MKPDPIRILVVDDEPLILSAVRMMLSYEGHIVEAVSDATKALAVFEPGKFDLVITDYMMPGMKGDALAIAIKAQAPQQPVILLSAHVQMIEGTASEVSCFDYVVSKPFRLEVLRMAVRRCLGMIAK